MYLNIAKYFTLICLVMYLFRWAIFVGYNINMHFFYPLYFYILELFRLGFWLLVLFYTIWPFLFRGRC